MPVSERKSSMLIVAPVRLLNCLWMPILGVAWLAVTIFGTPHLRVTYRWNGLERSPYYFACTYWGLTAFSVVPVGGECPLVVLARPDRRG